MKNNRQLVLFLATLCLVAEAHAAIYAIGFDAVATNYSAITEILSLSATDHVMTITDETNAQQYLSGASFHLTADLFRDDSSQGRAKGLFCNGAMSIHDSAGNLLLSGIADELYVEEAVYHPIIQITFLSRISLTGGQWYPSVGTEMDFFNLSWHTENPIDSFITDDLEASSSLKATMLPEPTTALLLVCGLAALRRHR